MSENERKKRLAYRKKRQKIILIQSIVAIVIALTVAVSAFAFFRIDNEFHVGYTESSSVDYLVTLKDNDFYDEEYLGKQAYIAALISSLVADFEYTFTLDSQEVSYNASYNLGTKLLISVKQSGKTLLTKDYPIKTNVPVEATTQGLVKITDTAVIDYDVYNDFANNLLDVYSLSGVNCSLIVYMDVNVSGKCADFEERLLSTHSTSLKIPLTQDLVEINVEASLPHDKNSVIVCNRAANRNTAMWFTIISGALEILLLIELLIFIYLTRNHDINYEIKVKRLVATYKSYIQRILTPFLTDGYQVLKVETFNEMLDIRDTVNLPILMSENADKTCTSFMIPANDKILYLFEIKVDDYDELYPETDTPDDTTNTQTAIIEEALIEEALNTAEEAVVTEELALADQAIGLFDRHALDYSFTAKLHLTNEETRTYYNEIYSFIASYGLKINRSWKKERVMLGRKTYAILSFRGLKLAVSFALNPQDYENTKYKLLDVSDVKQFAQVPAQMKITSERKAKWVKELLTEMLKNDGVENKNLNVIIKRIKPKTKKKLIEEKLIKID